MLKVHPSIICTAYPLRGRGGARGQSQLAQLAFLIIPEWSLQLDNTIIFLIRVLRGKIQFKSLYLI